MDSLSFANPQFLVSSPTRDPCLWDNQGKSPTAHTRRSEVVPGPPDRSIRSPRASRASQPPSPQVFLLEQLGTCTEPLGNSCSQPDAGLELLLCAGLAKLLIFHPKGTHPLPGHQIRAPGSVGGDEIPSSPVDHSSRFVQELGSAGTSSSPWDPRSQIPVAPSFSLKPELLSLGPPEPLLGTTGWGRVNSPVPAAFST